jgi:KDO2-lipid IV(A) lauroyltransferase
MRVASGVAAILARCWPRRIDRAKANIAMCFPDLSASEVDRLSSASMRYMMQLFMVDSIVMPRLITPRRWPQYVSFGDIGTVGDRLMRGESMILLTGHCGNWELLGYALSVMGHQVHALARPLDNPLIDQWLLGMRQRHGLDVISKFGATPELERILQEGGCLGFIADQNAGDQGLFVPFFGKLASTYKSIALLAMKYDVPVVAAHAVRVSPGFRYEIRVQDVIEPEDWAAQPDPLYYITARYNLALEMMIRSAPEQYLWLHRRWKSRPRHERRGKPVPPSLIRQLSQLPWLDDDAVQAIVDRSTADASNNQV